MFADFEKQLLCTSSSLKIVERDLATVRQLVQVSLVDRVEPHSLRDLTEKTILPIWKVCRRMRGMLRGLGSNGSCSLCETQAEWIGTRLRHADGGETVKIAPYLDKLVRGRF